MRLPASPFRRLLTTGVTPVLLVMLLGACAEQRQPGYYDTPRESTRTDARYRGQGDAAPSAPSQIQLGFGDETKKPSGQSAPAPAASTSASATPQPLIQPHTFLGTVPCLSGQACPPTRLTLTLAPDGQWRARSTMLNDAKSTLTQLGCWVVVGEQPLRIALRTADKQTKGLLEFVGDNVLRIHSLDGQRATLDYRLTRQPDTDPISELSQQPAEDCSRAES
jgi:hypothetical protein